QTLHPLGLDPVPAFACALSADHDGLQWTFLHQQPEDLRGLYGLEVTEEIVRLPLLATPSIDAPPSAAPPLPRAAASTPPDRQSEDLAFFRAPRGLWPPNCPGRPG